jgi:hypothetical protein
MLNKLNWVASALCLAFWKLLNRLVTSLKSIGKLILFPSASNRLESVVAIRTTIVMLQVEGPATSLKDLRNAMENNIAKCNS